MINDETDRVSQD